MVEVGSSNSVSVARITIVTDVIDVIRLFGFVSWFVIGVVVVGVVVITVIVHTVVVFIITAVVHLFGRWLRARLRARLVGVVVAMLVVFGDFEPDASFAMENSC